jgi:hypothetical protein
MNPSTSLLTLPLYSGGGTLQVIKELTTTTTLYDRVGWGDTQVSDAAAIQPVDFYHFARKQTDQQLLVDTNDNAQDFMSIENSCNDLDFSEVQPYATDQNGATIEAWVELLGGQNPTGPCVISSDNGKRYEISAADLPAAQELVMIDHSVSPQGTITPLQFSTPSGTLWIGSVSVYGVDGPVLLPHKTLQYQNVEKQQSWSLVSEYGAPTWKPTYILTPNGENALLTLIQAPVSGDPNACETIKINEIFPNATGSDTGREWIELINESTQVTDLSQCVISIADTDYYFLPDSKIGPLEYKQYASLWDESGNDKTIELRNTDLTIIALKRSFGSSQDVLQSFDYEDAPEAESYARFADGWRYTYAPTPNAENIYLAEKPIVLTTEHAAPTSAASIGTTSTTGSTASAKTAKTTATKTSTKSTVKAASTTIPKAAKSTSAKDVATTDARKTYEDPAKTSTSSLNPLVLVGTGAIALVYGGYEYRHDISNKVYQWRRNRTARRSGR